MNFSFFMCRWDDYPYVVSRQIEVQFNHILKRLLDIIRVKLFILSPIYLWLFSTVLYLDDSNSIIVVSYRVFFLIDSSVLLLWIPSIFNFVHSFVIFHSSHINKPHFTTVPTHLVSLIQIYKLLFIISCMILSKFYS